MALGEQAAGWSLRKPAEWTLARPMTVIFQISRALNGNMSSTALETVCCERVPPPLRACHKFTTAESNPVIRRKYSGL